MSQWTHVVGTIQCSWDEATAIEQLGKPVLWDDHRVFKYGTPEYEDYMENVWKKAFDDNEKGIGIPMGSEGSLDWYFVQTKDENVLGEGSLIAIQGDLRDYGGETEVQYIIDWFIKAVGKARFATLTINDDYSDEYVTVTINWGDICIVHYKAEGGDNHE